MGVSELLFDMTGPKVKSYDQTGFSFQNEFFTFLTESALNLPHTDFNAEIEHGSTEPQVN
jgi:hypothetical protein